MQEPYRKTEPNIRIKNQKMDVRRIELLANVGLVHYSTTELNTLAIFVIKNKYFLL